MVLLTYADDSGTHSGSKILALCGFLADAAVWEQLDDRWKAVLNKPEWPTRVTEFHTYDCVRGEGEFVPPWTYAQRLALYGDFVSLLITCGDLRAIGSAVVPSHFEGMSADDLGILKSERMGTPLEFAFHLLMQQIIHRSYEYWPSEEVGVVFDNSNREVEAKFRELYIAYRDNFKLGERLMRSPEFLSGKDATPLQAADLLAYGTYQVSLENYFPSDLEPSFPVIPAFMRMIQGVAHGGGIYDTDALKRLVNRVHSKDPSLIGNKNFKDRTNGN